MAPIRPIQLPKLDPTIVPTNAAVSNWPSMPMLTTPTRSPTRPVRPPQVIGTDSTTIEASMPTRLNAWPAAAQPRKASTKSPMAAPSTTLVHLPNPTANWSTPITTSETATMIAISRGSKVQLSENRSWASDRLKVASLGAVGIEREEDEHECREPEVHHAQYPLTLLFGCEADLQRFGRRRRLCGHRHADHPVEIWPMPVSSVLIR